jgi:3',5'-cyclic AMP phosphodiesterase CpdA
LNEFFDEVEPISSAKPYMVSPGNHEANCDNGGTTDKKNNITYTESLCMPGQKNFTGYRNHWKMPSAQSGGVENFWYSWDNGMVHYIIFNTETDFPDAPDLPGGEGKENAGPFAPNGTQLAWLKKDLAAVDRQKTPWIIAAGHRPWYVSNTECTECRAAFEGLFVQYGVDLLLFGHDHVYERLAPVGLGGVPDPSELNNPAAPWYVINGAAGHYDGLDTLGSPLIKSSRKAVDSVYGWNLFHVHNCTHLTTQFIASQNGSVLDEATLYKKRTCKFNGGSH